MEYIFLVVAIFWIAQFGMAHWQLRRFHQRIAELRRLGRTSVGMHGNRWRGRTYAVLTVDDQNIVRRAEVFTGMTVFAKLRPVASLEGRHLDSFDAAQPLPDGVSASQWAALAHAASFVQAARLRAATT